MIYIMVDTNTICYQVGATTLGAITFTTVGTTAAVNIFATDPSGQSWQMGASTSGQPTATTVTSTAPTGAVLADGSGGNWQVGITNLGQFTLTQIFDVQMFDLSPGCCVAWGE